MISAKVTGLEELGRYLFDTQRKIPRVQASALNSVSYLDVLPAQKSEMQRVFDRPTPYTLRSVLYRKATAAKTQAAVYAREAKGSTKAMTGEGYLGPQIFGGPRRDKASERSLKAAGILPQNMQMVPGYGLKRDKHGNVPGGRVAAILRALRGIKRGKDSKGRMRGSYTVARGKFVIGNVGKTQGIWQIVGKDWRPIFIFVKDIGYDAIYDFDGVTEKAFDANYPKRLDAAMERIIRG